MMMMMKLIAIAAVLSIAGAYPTKDDIVGEIQKVKGLSTEEKLEALEDKLEKYERKLRGAQPQKGCTLACTSP